jgi:hypothetical protein
MVRRPHPPSDASTTLTLVASPSRSANSGHHPFARERARRVSFLHSGRQDQDLKARSQGSPNRPSHQPTSGPIHRRLEASPLDPNRALSPIRL